MWWWVTKSACKSCKDDILQGSAGALPYWGIAIYKPCKGDIIPYIFDVIWNYVAPTALLGMEINVYVGYTHAYTISPLQGFFRYL